MSELDPVRLSCPLRTNTMADTIVTVSSPVAGVRVMALNRPQKRNALSQELIDTLARELGAAQVDDDVRVVVVTGSKTFFCGEHAGI